MNLSKTNICSHNFLPGVLYHSFSACKTAERGDAVASFSEATKELKLLADGNSSKPFSKIWMVQHTGIPPALPVPPKGGLRKLWRYFPVNVHMWLQALLLRPHPYHIGNSRQHGSGIPWMNFRSSFPPAYLPVPLRVIWWIWRISAALPAMNLWAPGRPFRSVSPDTWNCKTVYILYAGHTQKIRI